MDKNLLSLWQTVSSGTVKQEEIAELLQLSPRQTSRSIKKWTEQGWLLYNAGRGRGKASHLEWLQNVEEIYEEQLMKLINDEAIKKAANFCYMTGRAMQKTGS